MSSKPLGDDISRAEVLGISAEGISLSANSQEMFLAYHDFPWFKNAPPAKVRNVQMPAPDHFFWPDLDVDLTKEIILHPEKFPLKAGIN
jgi:hypothetical protein